MAAMKPAAARQPGAGSSEQGLWYGDLRHLERDMTGVMERVEGPVLAEAVEKVPEGKIFETMIQSSVLH